MIITKTYSFIIIYLRVFKERVNEKLTKPHDPTLTINFFMCDLKLRFNICILGS